MNGLGLSEQQMDEAISYMPPFFRIGVWGGLADHGIQAGPGPDQMTRSALEWTVVVGVMAGEVITRLLEGIDSNQEAAVAVRTWIGGLLNLCAKSGAWTELDRPPTVEELDTAGKVLVGQMRGELVAGSA